MFANTLKIITPMKDVFHTGWLTNLQAHQKSLTIPDSFTPQAVTSTDKGVVTCRLCLQYYHLLASISLAHFLQDTTGQSRFPVFTSCMPSNQRCQKMSRFAIPRIFFIHYPKSINRRFICLKCVSQPFITKTYLAGIKNECLCWYT